MDEDPQGFIDEVSKVVDAMGVTPIEKQELASYQLNNVAQVWLQQKRDKRPIREGPVDWEVFRITFLDRFSPIEMRERKSVEFVNLHQGRMSVKVYFLKFTQLSIYAPTL